MYVYRCRNILLGLKKVLYKLTYVPNAGFNTRMITFFMNQRDKDKEEQEETDEESEESEESSEDEGLYMCEYMKQRQLRIQENKRKLDELLRGETSSTLLSKPVTKVNN